MIEYVGGNLFDSNCQTLVCTVNCEGVMGKGIALQFKKKFPHMYLGYRAECDVGVQLKNGGDFWLYTYPDRVYAFYYDADGELRPGWQSKILCFATKEHWRNKSKYKWIERCLERFVYAYEHKIYGIDTITSIAFPKLGCENGGLDWLVVKPIMEKYLSRLPIKVEIYI